MKKRERNLVTLLTGLSFVVLSISGILSFFQPFSIQVIGLHALMGFVFVGIIALHVANNFGPLWRYARSRMMWVSLAIILGLTLVFLWQPDPIRRILRLSQNLGRATERFEVRNEGMTFDYSPAPEYKMTLTIRGGKAFDSSTPPNLAIWLENASFYHIKTLREPGDLTAGPFDLPYWDFKVRGWSAALKNAELSGEVLKEQSAVDGVAGATRNSSFDPADYILPSDSNNPMSYRLLIEIDQPEDDQPSLVYSVEIDNSNPRTFQVLDLVGYPKRLEITEDSKEDWALYFVDERFDSAVELIDSALLTIDRKAN